MIAVRKLWGAIASAPVPGGDGRRALVAVLAACLAIRLAFALSWPGIHHADEIYQAGEVASEAVHGYGIVPWEFRTASRTAILPTLLRPIYRLPGSATTHRVLQATMFCLLSLLPVWVAFAWTRRLFGVPAAVLAAMMMGTWFELVYFAPKATADAVSSYPLVAALYLGRPSASRREVFCAGMALALALGLRIQIAPAIGVATVALALAARGPRRPAFGLGLVVGAAIVGVIEWSWWGRPFQGQIGYLLMELRYRASAFFAREPVTFFAKEAVLNYGGALPVMVWLVWRGARVAPVLLLVAIAVLLPFHAIGHKEYRFMLPAVPLLVLLMGLGAGGWVANRAGVARRLPVIVGGWLIAMLAFSLGDHYRPYVTRDVNHVLAFEAIGRDPHACGVALVGVRWWHTPGTAGLGRDVPIYELTRPEDEARLFAAANYVLAGTKQPAPPPPFVEYRRFTRPVQSLYRRDGPCTPDDASKVTRPPGIPGLEP
ncbi:MAG: hypothetical protein IT184_11785 [Acidobacteria bacterium]|nr:hypothetical protein [Acidobacteriota bacterium]